MSKSMSDLNFPNSLDRYLALESMCLLATSEFSHEAVKKHQETVVNSLKVSFNVKRIFQMKSSNHAKLLWVNI